MKIAFFADTYYPHLNGVTTSVESQAKALRKLGHTVYIFAPSIWGYKDKDPYVIRIPSIQLFPTLLEVVRAPLPIPNKNFRKIYRLKFDLVHAHGNGAFSFIGYQVARFRKIPYVLTFHTLFTKYTHYFLYGKVIKPEYASKFMKLFSNFCDGVLVPSEKMKYELQKCGVEKDIIVIPNFIDLERFKKVKKGYLHKKCNIPKDSSILLSVGRLGREKNFEFLFTVFKKLIESDNNTHLVIIGYGRDKKYLLKYVQNMGISEKVHFTGKISQEDMPFAYSDSDIFVFASNTETQGICVLEAAACSLPLILANDLAYKGMIEEGINGYSVQIKEEIFLKVLQKLLKDKDLREKFGQNSIKIVQQNFSEETIAQKLLDFYNHLILENSYKMKKNRKKAF